MAGFLAQRVMLALDPVASRESEVAKSPTARARMPVLVVLGAFEGRVLRSMSA